MVKRVEEGSEGMNCGNKREREGEGEGRVRVEGRMRSKWICWKKRNREEMETSE